MTTERGSFGAALTGHPPHPVLGVQQNIGGLPERLGKPLLQPVQLPPQVQARRQIGRAGFGEIRSNAGVVPSYCVRARVFIIQNRKHQPITGALPINEGRRSAVGGDTDCGDGKRVRHLANRLAEPVPYGIHIEVGIKRILYHGIAPGFLEPTLEMLIENMHFNVGFTNIQNQNVTH